MSTKTALKSTIGLIAKGERYPVMTIVREDPELAAVLSKLVTQPRVANQFDQHGRMKTGEPNISELRNLADDTARNISDAETTLSLLPETELAATILISCILAPKDMTSTKLNYGAADDSLPPDVTGALVKCLQDYFETDYNIKSRLPAMLWDMIVDKGSYPVAVIPENAIDEVINSNRRMKLEHFAENLDSEGRLRPLGLLGPARRKNPLPSRKYSAVSVEAFDDTVTESADPKVTLLLKDDANEYETYLTVTDNFSVLKIPEVNQKIREQRISQKLGKTALEKFTPSLEGRGASLEARGETNPSKLSDRELHSLLYKDVRHTYKPIDTMMTQERLNRRTVGSPLIMHMPAEAVIPVFVPGNVSQQVGFFVLLDQNGNPVTRSDSEDHYMQMQNRMSTGGSFASAMLNKVQANVSGLDYDNTNRSHLNYSAQVYGQMVEQDLLARLRNGSYTNGVSLAAKPEIYRLMFARALAAQHTQLLFLPAELMTYFAFKYTQNGIGRSVLDEMKILSSMRAMLTFANTMAAMKNSIGRTGVEIKLDEADPDPQKTIERYIHEIARTRQNAFPIGITSPVDLTDYIQRSGFEFSWTGNPRIPDTSLTFTEKNSSYVKPDQELQDDLRKRAIQKFGIPAPVVDAGAEAEFATSIVTSNILVSKNVAQKQEQLEPQIEDHCHKVAMNDSRLIANLRRIIEENYEKIYERLVADEKSMNRHTAAMDESKAEGTADAAQQKEQAKGLIIQEVLYGFVMGFTVRLPRPSSVSLAAQLEEFKKYQDALDSALDVFISTNILNSDTLGDISEHVDVVKENLKSLFSRKWMAENGMLLELTDLVSLDSEGKPMVDLTDSAADHAKSIGRTINSFMESLDKMKKAANKLEQERKAADTGEGGAEPTTSESSSSSSSSDLGGGDMGLGDLGLGSGSDDFGLGGAAFGASSTGEDSTETPGANEDENEDEENPDGEENTPDGGAS